MPSLTECRTQPDLVMVTVQPVLELDTAQPNNLVAVAIQPVLEQTNIVE